MSEAASPPDIKRYEQACDQAIAMCDGNLRSTIKALNGQRISRIRLHELQAAASSDQPPAQLRGANNDAA